MVRELIKIDESNHKDVCICVDYRNAEDILTYVFKDGVDKEFKEIRGILKENLRNKQKYCKADVSKKAKKIYEMRFTRQRNDRIYCKELHQSKRRIIVMIDLYIGKKSQNIPKKIKKRIEKIGRYEYDIR